MLVLENVCGLLAVPAWLWLAKRKGKHVAMLGAALWSGIWSVPLFWMGPGDGWWFVFIIAMRAVSLTAWILLIPSMTADAVDADTLAAGRERTGLFFGALGFWAKAAGAIGILIGTALPALAGFQPSDTEHSPEALLALRLVYAFVGPALVIAAAFCFGRFPITQDKQREIREAIDRRVQGEAPATA
jgi:GPH family glycoside/pentoside/hexuronide:cation symporter